MVSIEVQSSSDNESSESDEEDVQCIEVSESDTEPEFECDTWDDTCKTVSMTASLPGIQGCMYIFISRYIFLNIYVKWLQYRYFSVHLMPTCLPEPESKQMKLSVELVDNFKEESFVNAFKEAWTKDEAIKEKSHELVVDPFKLCVLQNFLYNTDILDEARQEFNEVPWNHRNMDLYELFQSEDLKKLDNFKHINLVYEFLKNDVMKWVRN